MNEKKAEQVTVYNKHNLNVVKVVDRKDNDRESLKTVFFTKDVTVATDGSMLIEVTACKADRDSFPSLPGAEPVTIEEGRVISVEPVNSMRKNLPKNNCLPLLNNVWCRKDTAELVEFVSTDLQNVNPVLTKPVEGKYPDYKQGIPVKKPKMSIFLDVKYLITLLECFEGFSKSVKVDIYDTPLEPVKLSSENREQKITAVIMPRRG